MMQLRLSVCPSNKPVLSCFCQTSFAICKRARFVTKASARAMIYKDGWNNTEGPEKRESVERQEALHGEENMRSVMYDTRPLRLVRIDVQGASVETCSPWSMVMSFPEVLDRPSKHH